MDQKNIPDELTRALSDALQNICFYIHNNVGNSQVILNVQHVSDAVYRSGSTSISILGGGIRVEVEPNKDGSPANKEQVDKLVADLMKKAQEKAAEKKADDKPKE